MDLSAFYQLKERLYASAAAGCGAISEDFRLKRAIENFEPLSKANKVFKKLYDTCGKLVNSEKPSEVIVDCIALADALAVTQGTFAEKSETHKQADINLSKPANIYSSVLNQNISELKTNVFNSFDKNIISDPRFINAFIRQIGSGSPYFEYIARMIISIYGENIVPVLKQTLANRLSAGGKIVEYVFLAAKEKENDWYISLVNDEKTPASVKTAAVRAMVSKPENDAILEQIYNTQKGNVRKAALISLAKIGGEISEKVMQKICGKFAKTNADAIAASSGETCTEFVKKYINEKLDTSIAPIAPEVQETVITMLANKKGLETEIVKISEQLDRWKINSMNDMLIKNVINNNDEYYRQLIDTCYKNCPENFGKAYFFLHSAFIDEDFSTETAYNIKKIVNENREDCLRTIATLTYYKTEDTFKISTDYYNYNTTILNSITVTEKQVLRMLDIAGDVSYLKEAAAVRKKSSVENEINHCINISVFVFNQLLNQLSVSEEMLKKIKQKAVDFAAWCVDNYPTDQIIILFNNVTNGKASEQKPHIIENYINFNIECKNRAVNISDLRLIPDDIITRELPQIIEEYSQKCSQDKKMQQLINSQLKKLKTLRKELNL